MTDHTPSLGDMNVGILIKTIPTQGVGRPTKKKPGFPICEFDVFVTRLAEPALDQWAEKMKAQSS